jgi:phosphoribosylanthranilate isomerase
MKVKICGLTKPEEAQYLNKNQVDFAGMVLFFPKSKRNITISQAKKIMSELNLSIKSVAVVVSPSIQEIEQIETAGFNYIQIHGDLTEEMLEHIHLPIIKAFNIVDMDNYEQYHACSQVAGYVFDAIEPGSGKTFDWSLVKKIPRDEKLLLLAGGLNPDNVGEAIKYLQPDGVDVSSGVEYTDRLGKDEKKVDLFVANARKIL